MHEENYKFSDSVISVLCSFAGKIPKMQLRHQSCEMVFLLAAYHSDFQLTAVLQQLSIVCVENIFPDLEESSGALLQI